MNRKKQEAVNAFRSAMAELPPDQQAIVTWLRSVKFKRKLFGGVEEADVWRKLEELNALYEKALLLERARLSGEVIPSDLPIEEDPEALSQETEGGSEP